MGHQVLGTPCDNTTYYAFGIDSMPTSPEAGRLMFCGSPRRYEPRWFRSPPMAGVKDEGAECHQWLNYVAQAPDDLPIMRGAEGRGARALARNPQVDARREVDRCRHHADDAQRLVADLEACA